MQEQGLQWIALPYLQTATPAIPLSMTILGKKKKNRVKTVKNAKGGTPQIKSNKLAKYP